jgi:Fe(3+) dicitrate transport protein
MVVRSSASFSREEPRASTSRLRLAALSLVALFGAQPARAQDPAVPAEGAPSEPAPTEPAPTEGAPPSAAPAGDAPDTSAEAPTPAPGEPSGAEPEGAPAPASSPEAAAGADAPAATPTPVAESPGGPSEPAPIDAKKAEAEPIEVLIVGTRLSRTPGSAQVIRDKDLQRFEYDDPTSVLTQVPGVYSRTEDGMGLRPNIGMRGVNPDRSKKITLMEDGVLFGPAPYSAPAAYYFPMITRMTQVRVTKGPGAVAYGPQTIAGAIDLITRGVPTKPTGGADVAAGQYGYGKGHMYFGAGNERYGFMVEGLRLQNTGFKTIMGDPGADTGFTRDEWMAKFNYVVDPDAAVRNEFRLKLGYYDEVSNETYMGLSQQDFDADPYARYGATAGDRMTNHRTAVALTHQVDFTPRMNLTTTVYRNDFHRIWRRADGFNNGPDVFDVLDNTASSKGSADQIQRQRYIDVLRGLSTFQDLHQQYGYPLSSFRSVTNQRDFVSEGVQSVFRWDTETGAIAHRLEAGMRVHYDQIERHHTKDDYDLVKGQEYQNGDPTTDLAFNKASTLALSPHVLYAMTYKGLTVTPGMRMEIMHMNYRDHETGLGYAANSYAILPGVGAYYALTETLGLLAGIHRGFSPVTPDSAKTAKAENSVNYEVGTRLSDGALKAEVIGFYNDYSNLTDICNDGNCPTALSDKQFDAGNARIYGVEMMASHEIPAGPVKIPLSVNYTYTQAQFLRSFVSGDPLWGDVQKGDIIPNIPKHQLRAQAGVEGKPAGGNVAVTYVGSTGDGSTGVGADRHVLRTDAQYLVDASAYVHVWGPIQVYTTGQNLFNSVFVVSHRPFGLRPNAPRWIHAGIKAAF